MKVKRYDIGSFSEPEITPQGFLKVPALATKTGIFEYVQSDGTIFREFRPPEEVFDKNSMYTLSNVPITDNHPSQMVTSENAKELQVGFTGDLVEKVDDHVRVNAIITDADMIAKLRGSKKREVSCGYSVILDMTPGEYNGQRYDAVQRGIVYNHLAVVDKGRAGPNARLQMDRHDAQMITDFSENKKIGGCSMVKIKLKGIEYEASEGLAQDIRKLDTESNELKEKNDEYKKLNSELNGKVDTLNKELEKRDAEIESLKKSKLDSKEIVKIAKGRIELEDFAKEILGENAKAINFDELSDVDVKKSVVCHVNKDMDVEGKEDGYIDGAFSIIKTSYKKTEKSDHLKNNIRSFAGKANTTVLDSEAARERQRENALNQWKTGTGK